MRSNIPIIVGGPHRSGTSLIRRLLHSHPNIYCGPEVKFFEDFFKSVDASPKADYSFMHTACSMVSPDILFDILGHAFIQIHEKAALKHNKSRWADKCPENILFLGKWEKLLGDQWLFLHVARNPLDTLASQNEIKFDRVLPLPLSEKIKVYVSYHKAGLDFQKKYPDRYYRIVYEDLTTNPFQTIRDMDTWLGESFSFSQLDLSTSKFQQGIEDPKIAFTNSVHSNSTNNFISRLNSQEIKLITMETQSIWKTLDTNNRFCI